VSDRALSGTELARQFHVDVVAPLLTRAMPGLRYAAGRLGSGSDVLGLDDEMSARLAGDLMWLAFALSRQSAAGLRAGRPGARTAEM
jgi:hypothetical protein